MLPGFKSSSDLPPEPILSPLLLESSTGSPDLWASVCQFQSFCHFLKENKELAFIFTDPQLKVSHSLPALVAGEICRTTAGQEKIRLTSVSRIRAAKGKVYSSPEQ